MTKRLTSDLRATIIDNVVRATNIPELKADLKQRTKTAARDIVIAANPPGFAALVANAPKEWFQTMNNVYLKKPISPVAALDAQNSGSEFYIYLDDPVTVPASGVKDLDLTPIERLKAEADTLVERERALRNEIAAFLNSCRTVEQVLERMPELEPHVPKAVKPMPLVAPSNLLSTLAQLGFDKTVRDGQAA